MGRIAERQQQQDVRNVTANWSNKEWLNRYKPQIARALPNTITADRFVRICMTELSRNETLAKCSPNSFIGAVLQGAQCGLEIGGVLGQAYLVPYWSGKKQCYEAQLQIGYKGLIQLCRRSGDISLVKAQTVYKNDTFRYELGLNPDLIHIPAKGDRGDPVAYYAFYKTKDGSVDFEVMTHEEVLAHAHKYSKSSTYSQEAKTKVFKADSPWAKDFEAMALKTVLKKALKYAPMSTDFMAKVAVDETINTIDIKQEEPGENEMLEIETNAVYEDESVITEDGEVVENAKQEK